MSVKISIILTTLLICSATAQVTFAQSSNMPLDADQIRLQGDSFAEKEDYVKAAEYYQRLVDNGNYEPDDLFILSNYYLLVAGTEGLNAMTKANAIAKAQKYIEEVDKLVPGNVKIVNCKAKVARFREGDNPNGAALAAYNELLNILDKTENKAKYARYYKYAYSYLATYYFGKGDRAKAANYFQKWLEYDPDNEQLRNYVISIVGDSGTVNLEKSDEFNFEDF